MREQTLGVDLSQPHLQFCYGSCGILRQALREFPIDFTDRIRCPIMVLSGEDDTNPSPEQTARIDADLTRQGTVHAWICNWLKRPS